MTIPVPPLSATPTRYSSADLLAMCKFQADRPAVDAQMPDDAWYRLLTEAQDLLLPEIATRAPSALNQQYATLETTDGGITYTFGLDVYGEPVVPFGHIEVWANDRGRQLFAASYQDRGNDFVIEATGIRMPGNVPGRFAEGPFARWTSVPPAITATAQPIIQPRPMRALLVDYACLLWAQRGGKRDPTPWVEGFRNKWMGDPRLGTLGWCATLQTRFTTGMVPANGRSDVAWWQAQDWSR